jgi:hypothetical protein
MPFVDHDHAIETVASDRPDQPLDVGILPRGSCRGEHLFEADCRDPLLEGFAVDLVPVTQQVLGRFLPRERLHDLLRGPRRRRVRGHVEVQDSPTVMGEPKEHEEDLVPNGRPSRFSASAQLGPVFSEPASSPCNDRLGLDEDQHLTPPGPMAGEPRPKDPLGRSDRRTSGRPLVDGKLVPECEDLDLHGESGPEEIPKDLNEGRQRYQHSRRLQRPLGGCQE